MILANRHRIYQDAKLKHPERWTGKTRNWQPDTKIILKKFKRLRTEETVEKKAALLFEFGTVLSQFSHGFRRVIEAHSQP